MPNGMTVDQGAAAIAATEAFARDIMAGRRRALAKAITLIESTRADHRTQAEALLTALAQAGAGRDAPLQADTTGKGQAWTGPGALRIGLSGTPGVGKSSFIEAFGLMLIAAGLKVAVLAVDPSSARSGGSILGDKTRMEMLSRAPNAFIRPSPAASTLGGVARRTREAIMVCDAAGFDVILVETVGVGQSETAVADMTDVFVLLLAPAGGDELQGVKRGIMELADIVLINKADGELLPVARATCADYAGALRLMHRPAPENMRDPEGFPCALTVSALTGAGIETAWDRMRALANARHENGALAHKHAIQQRAWFEAEVNAGLRALLDREPRARAALSAAHALMDQGILPVIAARGVLAKFAAALGDDNTDPA